MDHRTPTMIRGWMTSAFVMLFLASILGLLMRLMAMKGIPAIPFKNVLHAHSHTALLGFGFLFMLGSFIFLILPVSRYKRLYRRLSIIYIAAAVGMFISFLYQSYGAISITFSTIIMLVAYTMIYFFLKDYKKASSELKNPLIKWSIYWFLISTLGIWAVGPVTAILGRTHELYFLSIQFFLHFQFNGWFTLSILGLLIYLAKKRGLDYKVSTPGLWFLNMGLVLTYFLSVTFVRNLPVYFVLTSTGAIFQIIAYYLILKPVIIYLIKTLDFTLWTTRLLLTGAGCLVMKLLLQSLVILPSLAVVSYSVREFIVGYIHLILLGGMTLTGAGILLKEGVLIPNPWNKIGWLGLAITFVIMEVILFGYAILTWQGIGNALLYITTMFYVTLLFPIFTGFIAYGAWLKQAPAT